jgi:hypothetical protein
MRADPETVTIPDMVRMSSNMASYFDPTGIAEVVGSFSYSKCSDIKI